MSELSYLVGLIPLVKSLQTGSVTGAGSTGGRAAITAVSTAAALVLPIGAQSPNTGTPPPFACYLTSATQVRVDTGSTSNTYTFYFAVVEFRR